MAEWIFDTYALVNKHVFNWNKNNSSMKLEKLGYRIKKIDKKRFKYQIEYQD